MRILTIFFLLIINSQSVLACSCIGWDTESVQDRIRRSSSIILGIPVTNSTYYDRVNTPDNYTRTLQSTKIRIIKSFKNSLPKEIMILSESSDGANCGVNFSAASNTYLIFLSNSSAKGQLETNLCDTALLSSDNEAITRIILDLL